ncbi:glycosyltransferase family 39 protein [Patescibacteria group bacterium]|nr:glycosyltransferase family 39 protein [Patescibacteria group bacterium]
MENKVSLKIFKNVFIQLNLIFLSSLVLFYPSLNTFFTHDDFYHLNISNVNTITGFLKFFDLTHSWTGYGHFRPLSDQLLYFVDIKLFNLNPVPLHILSFMVLFSIVIIVYKITLDLTHRRSIALLLAFFYSTSSTNFERLYFLQGLQELVMGVFFFLCAWLFIKYLERRKASSYLFCFCAFVLALFSKETAAVLPIVLLSIYFLEYWESKKTIAFRDLVRIFTPFILTIISYLYLHIFKYGLAQGDSYVWIISPRLINTLVWYALWSFNIPEMLVDYIGPGLHINPNLFRYYSEQIIPILSLFMLLVISILFITVRSYQKYKVTDKKIIIFGMMWFILGLLPVLFLPWHKFTIELTVPLFGLLLTLTVILDKAPRLVMIVIVLLFFVTSVLTNNLTYQTHWIVQGAKTAQRTLNFLNGLGLDSAKVYTVEFYDLPKDKGLPWSPTEQLKTILSDQNFFEVYFPQEINVVYKGTSQLDVGIITIPSRQMLDYQ